MITKIQAFVDDLGMFAYFSFTAGQASDTGEQLLFLSELKSLSLAANKAYDTNAILQHLKSLDIQTITLVKKNDSDIDEDFLEIGISCKLGKDGMPYFPRPLLQSVFTHCSEIQNQVVNLSMDFQYGRSINPLLKTVDYLPLFGQDPKLFAAKTG